MNHPSICFGISRHNKIIPLKVVEVVDYKDGCFNYIFAVNHPNPTEYMECQQSADFTDRIVSADAPLCDEFTRIQPTLIEAKAYVSKKLIAERAAATMKISEIDGRLAKIEAEAEALDAAIKDGETA